MRKITLDDADTIDDTVSVLNQYKAMTYDYISFTV